MTMPRPLEGQVLEKLGGRSRARTWDPMDTELKGFFVVVGKRKRTFTVQGDLRQDGKRASSIRVAIGGTDEMSTRSARATAKEYLALSRGQHPRDER